MSPTYKTRLLVDARNPRKVIDTRARRVGVDGLGYSIISIHPCRDLITIVRNRGFEPVNLKELEQVAPSFIGARIVGG